MIEETSELARIRCLVSAEMSEGTSDIADIRFLTFVRAKHSALEIWFETNMLLPEC